MCYTPAAHCAHIPTKCRGVCIGQLGWLDVGVQLCRPTQLQHKVTAPQLLDADKAKPPLVHCWGAPWSKSTSICAYLDEHDVIVEGIEVIVVDVYLWDIEDLLESFCFFQTVFTQHHHHQTAPAGTNKVLHYVHSKLQDFTSKEHSVLIRSAYDCLAVSVLTVSSSGQQTPPTEGAPGFLHSSAGRSHTARTPDIWWSTAGPPDPQWSSVQQSLWTVKTGCMSGVRSSLRGLVWPVGEEMHPTVIL